MNQSRREFIKHLGFLSGAAAFSQLAALAHAPAQTISGNDYKAIVCLFLYGGNDSGNMLVPFDATNYALYSKSRGSLALGQSQLLPLQGLPYAIHPSMPEVQTMFAQKDLAFVVNMGPLVTPLSKNQYLAGSVPLPQNLFSHPDQQSLMQTGAFVSGAGNGWGGSFIDALPTNYKGGVLPQAISYAGGTVFINGPQSTGFIAPSNPGASACQEGAACAAVQEAAAKIAACENSVVLVQQDASFINTINQENQAYAQVLSGVSPLQTQFSPGVGSALQQVAQLIQVRDKVGAPRQVFFVGLGSFDTHATQLDYHAQLLKNLSSGLSSWKQAAEELGIWNNVVLLTLSDFNRTLMANSSGGSDHAWGGHQIVMGGPVQGGSVYGTFPTLELGGPDDVDTVGRLLPTTSLTQVLAELASWFGVPASSIASLLPNLINFQSPSVGFIRAS